LFGVVHCPGHSHPLRPMQTCIRPSAGAHWKPTVGQVLSTTAATTSAPSAHQTSYGWLREVLRGAARAEVASGPTPASSPEAPQAGAAATGSRRGRGASDRPRSRRVPPRRGVTAPPRSGRSLPLVGGV